MLEPLPTLPQLDDEQMKAINIIAESGLRLHNEDGEDIEFEHLRKSKQPDDFYQYKWDVERQLYFREEAEGSTSPRGIYEDFFLCANACVDTKWECEQIEKIAKNIVDFIFYPNGTGMSKEVAIGIVEQAILDGNP